MSLGATATVEEIMTKLQSVFGNVATRGSIMRKFDTAIQKQDESVTAWGLRLEEKLQKATEKGHVRSEEKNDLLKDAFWRGLRSERLKNATRVHFELISNFELLRRAVRGEEKPDAHQHWYETATAESVVEQTNDDDPKYKQLLRKIEYLEKSSDTVNRDDRTNKDFKDR